MAFKTCFANRLLTAGALSCALLGLFACGGDTPEKSLASAETYLAKSDARAAIIEAKNALQSRPDWAPARFLLGRALLESGDPVAAAVEFEKARELKHPDDAVVPALARALMLQGKFKIVLDRFGSTALTSAAGVADLQTTLALSHLSLADRAAGERALARALEAKGDHVPALLARSRLMAASGQMDAALALVESTLSSAPENPEVWALKGDLLLRSKSDASAAELAYRKALEYRKDYLPAHMGMVLAALSRLDVDAASKHVDALKQVLPQHPQTRFLMAQLAFAKNDDKGAKELALQLLRIAPNDARLLHLAGAVELRSGALLQAQTYLQKSLQLAPENRAVRVLLAQSHVRHGQATTALSILAPLLDGASKDAEAIAVAAQAHASLGDLKKAESLYATAAKLNPADQRNASALALTHLALGDKERGFAELQLATQRDAGTSADIALVNVYLRTREYAKALQAIDALERKSPSNAASTQMRGLAQLGLKQSADARKSFDKALSLDQNYLPAIESLAAMDIIEKNPARAAKRFESLLSRQPDNLQAQMAVAALRARDGASTEEVARLIGAAIRSSPNDAMPRLRLLELQIASKQLGPALVSAQEAVAAIPGNADLLDALGRVQALSGDSNQARATFAKLASLQPESPLPQLRIAELQRLDKDPVGAAESLRRALAIKPDFLEAQRRLIGLELGAGHAAAALRIAKTVQSQRPKDAIGYLLEGDIEATRKDMNAALAAYRAGLKSAPQSSVAVKLHATLLQVGKRAEADAVAAAWLKDRPGDVAFLQQLGQLAIERGAFDEAERQFAAVVQIAPRHVVALNNLAWARSKQGKPEALAPALQANEIAPDQPPLMETLAVAMALNQQLPKAIELQQKVVKLQPGNNGYRLTLARLYIQAGQSEQARSELTLLSNLGEKFAGQSEVARMLKSL